MDHGWTMEPDVQNIRETGENDGELRHGSLISYRRMVNFVGLKTEAPLDMAEAMRNLGFDFEEEREGWILTLLLLGGSGVVTLETAIGDVTFPKNIKDRSRTIPW